MLLALFLGGVAAAVAAVLLAPRLRERRRRRLRAQSFPPAWTALLVRDVPLYRRLPEALREQLHGHIQVFLAEKNFVGCGGLTVTAAMRVTVAAHACMLLFNREVDYFPGFTSILLYPDAFVVPRVMHDGLVETRDTETRAGESWQRGPVILSWADILRNADQQRPEHNVVLHEFAHKLDSENALMDGLPMLDDAAQYGSWTEIMQSEYESLRQAQADGATGALDGYGATAPAEFFAVATETFFERSRELERDHPRLYAELRNFYRVDPARWGR